MHIVYVSREYPPSLRGGGIASYIKEMAHGMVAAGNQVTVVCASDDTRVSSDIVEDGVRIIRLSGGSFYVDGIEKYYKYKKLRPAYRFNSYRKKIRKTILELYGVDIIECADFGAEAYYLLDIPIPVTIRMHMPGLFNLSDQGVNKLTAYNFPFYWIYKTEMELVKKCKYITSCSEALKTWTSSKFGVTPSNITVIPNPCDLFKIDNFTEDENILNPDALNVVYVGTICAAKGCEELVSACKQIKSIIPTLNLWLFGKEGSWATELHERNNCYDWIHFFGKVERNMLFPIFRHADVVALPSWFDNFPMACIEAMMCRSIIIGSNAGGMSEMIKDGVSGFLVEPKNTDMLVEKLDLALHLDDFSKQQMKEAARKKAVECYSSNVIIQKMSEYYSAVINDFKISNSKA